MVGKECPPAFLPCITSGKGIIMPIDIENLNPSTKFPYPLLKDGNEEKDEWVTVRILSAENLEKINKKTTEVKKDFVQPRKANGKIDRRAALQRIEYLETTEPALRNELMWDAVIDEIHIYDTSGNLIPSTTEIKIKLMENSAGFAMYIADCLEILTGDEKEEERELEKNCTSSQSE